MTRASLDKRIRVVVADDQPAVRAGLVSLLSLVEDIEVVAEAADGTEAIQKVIEHKPDVLLLDIRMPNKNGLEVTLHISENPHIDQVSILILTTFEDDEYVFGALTSGAKGFLLKDVEPNDLYNAIRLVANGHSLVGPSASSSIAKRLSSNNKARSNYDISALTDREREVLQLVGRGLSNDEIATRLIMSPLTAKTHVSRTMSKLNARDRAQLVRIAYECGLVSPGES